MLAEKNGPNSDRQEQRALMKNVFLFYFLFCSVGNASSIFDLTYACPETKNRKSDDYKRFEEVNLEGKRR